MFLGNSITEIGDWKKVLNDSTVINRGIRRGITLGLLKRLKEVIDWQPYKIFLLIFVNDIGKDILETVIIDDYKKLLKDYSGNGRQPIYIFNLY